MKIYAYSDRQTFLRKHVENLAADGFWTSFLMQCIGKRVGNLTVEQTTWPIENSTGKPIGNC